MGINNCNCRNKGTCPLTKSCQTKCIVYQANIDCDIAGYKQNCYLGSCETTFKDGFGNLKSRSTMLNIKTTRNYQKTFGKLKSAVERQKSQGRLLEYVVLTIQSVSAAFCVYMRNMKLPHTKKTTF